MRSFNRRSGGRGGGYRQTGAFPCLNAAFQIVDGLVCGNVGAELAARGVSPPSKLAHDDELAAFMIGQRGVLHLSERQKRGASDMLSLILHGLTHIDKDGFAVRRATA